ncbi:MAG: zinc ribbon domain-containing protein [Bacteroidales bacterium]|nr:zinc ribbon domain-containing protein [Bacteroidales bacterium]
MGNDFETETLKTNQHEVTCKQCGAKLVFAPGINKLKCEYCGAENEIHIEPVVIEEMDYVSFISKHSDTVPKHQLSTVRCNSCGAQTTFDSNVVSELCPFCGSVLTVKNSEIKNVIKPWSVLPFKIDTKRAFQCFQNWLRKLWFAPNDLKKYATQQEKLKGLYIPYWTYDSSTITHYHGLRGDNYTTTETYTTVENGKTVTRTRTVVKTRWTPVSGTVYVNFDDVLVLASKSLPQKYTDRLEPWDLSELVPFDEKFLSGFRTETYQIDVKEGFEIGKEKMNVAIRQAIRQDIGGDHQQILNMKVHYDDITFKHILLPIWISAYRYKNKIYRFMVNGQTGEVQGERPYSWVKITLTILFVVGIIALIVFLLDK